MLLYHVRDLVCQQPQALGVCGANASRRKKMSEPTVSAVAPNARQMSSAPRLCSRIAENSTPLPPVR